VKKTKEWRENEGAKKNDKAMLTGVLH